MGLNAETEISRNARLAVERANELAAKRDEHRIALSEALDHNKQDAASALLAVKAALLAAQEEAEQRIADLVRARPARHCMPVPRPRVFVPRRNGESPYYCGWSLFD